MEELSINKIKLLLLTFLIFTISSCLGTAAEIHVSSGGSIQAAVNSAHSGDTIIVDPGTYNGNIDISRFNDLNDLRLISASGNPANTFILANNSAPSTAGTVGGVINIRYKNNVTVSGFTISGASRTNAAGAPDLAGVCLFQSTQCSVENNDFSNDNIGVLVDTATGSNAVSNNNITRSGTVRTGTGISISNSPNTRASQNSATNQSIGIYVKGSSSRGSLLSGNILNNNANYGIQMEDARNVNIDGNTLNLDGLAGIYMARSDGNNFTNNKAQMTAYQINVNNVLTNTNAISLLESNSNTISNNEVTKAAHGIFLAYCDGNTVQNNKASGNLYGIAMRYSNNNRVINNNADQNDWGLFFTYQDSGNKILSNTANGCVNAGIYLNSDCRDKNVVDNNTVNSNQYYGIHLETYGNTVSNNTATGNGRGIFLTGSACHDNVISKNILNYNTGNGIRLVNTTKNNKLTDNTIVSSSGDGVYIFNSNFTSVDSNMVQGNNIGIHVENSTDVTFNNNTAPNNKNGLRLFNTNNSTVSKNVAYGSTEYGIVLNSALNNTVTGNTVYDNTKAGISMCPACRQNLIYNNYLNNENNADVKNAANTWYITRTPGKNIVKGPYIGGNFWASPGGAGFSEAPSTARDTNGDGIVDTPYTVTASDGSVLLTDIFPLVNVVLPVPEFSMSTTQGTAPLSVQFTDNSQNAESRRWNFGDGNTSTELNPTNIYSKVGTYTVNLTVSNKNDSNSKLATVTVQAYVAPPVYPVADFTADQTSGYAPLTVKFTDASQNAAAWNWNFGDGGTSTEQSPTYIYNSEGTFTVNLVASNANGTSSKVSTITVSSTSSGGSSSGSSSSSSGGSGGGGGGSPEPQNNVAIKELSQTSIFASQPVKFEFPQKVTAVESITFNSKKSVGKTTTIVEMLKNQSTLVSGKPSDEVYKYLNIWVGNGGYATPKNIENAVVTFKVAKSWVQDNKIDKSSITLNRYDNKTWNPLTTTLSSEDDSTYLKFTAQAPGFSPFAITGKSTAIQPAAGDKTQPATVSQTQSNTGNGSTANTNKTAEQKESPSPTQKQSTSLPGFEAVIGVAGLVAVFLYRRK